jgi:hypothetical protein
MGLSFVVAQHIITDFAKAFALIRREHPDAMHVALNPGTSVNRKKIVEFASESVDGLQVMLIGSLRTLARPICPLSNHLDSI